MRALQPGAVRSGAASSGAAEMTSGADGRFAFKRLPPELLDLHFGLRET